MNSETALKRPDDFADISESANHSPNDDIPIYQLQTKDFDFEAKLSSKPNQFCAYGDIVGNFYTVDEAVRLQNVYFVGRFKGAVEIDVDNKNPFCFKGIHFEGTITHFLLLSTIQEG